MGNDGAHLDRSPTNRGNAGRQSNGFVEILGFDEIVAAELFLGFGEWTVGDEAFFVAQADGGRRGSVVELVAPAKMPALGDALGVVSIFLADALALGFAELVPVGLVSIDQKQVLHV